MIKALKYSALVGLFTLTNQALGIEMHPSGATHDFVSMPAKDLKALYDFLTIDDLSQLERIQENKPPPNVSRRQMALPRNVPAKEKAFLSYRVFRKIGEVTYFQSRAFNIETHHRLENALNVRRPLDWTTARDILLALEQRLDEDSKAVLWEIVRQPDDILFAHYYEFANHQILPAELRRLDETLRRIQLVFRLQRGTAVDQQLTRSLIATAEVNLIKPTQDEYLGEILKFQTATSIALALYTLRLRFSLRPWQKIFKFDASSLKDAIIVEAVSKLNEPKKTSDQPPSICTAAQSLLTMREIYFKLSHLGDPFAITSTPIRNQLETLYDRSLSDPEMTGHPLLNSKRTLPPEEIIAVIATNSSHNTQRLLETCEKNMQRLAIPRRPAPGKKEIIGKRRW